MSDKTISAKDLRRNHEGKRPGDFITIDDKRYFVGRYFARDDAYELIEQVRVEKK